VPGGPGVPVAFAAGALETANAPSFITDSQGPQLGPATPWVYRGLAAAFAASGPWTPGPGSGARA
jgi:hypothetical protein